MVEFRGTHSLPFAVIVLYRPPVTTTIDMKIASVPVASLLLFSLLHLSDGLRVTSTMASYAKGKLRLRKLGQYQSKVDKCVNRNVRGLSSRGNPFAATHYSRELNIVGTKVKFDFNGDSASKETTLVTDVCWTLVFGDVRDWVDLKCALLLIVPDYSTEALTSALDVLCLGITKFRNTRASKTVTPQILPGAKETVQASGGRAPSMRPYLRHLLKKQPKTGANERCRRLATSCRQQKKNCRYCYRKGCNPNSDGSRWTRARLQYCVMGHFEYTYHCRKGNCARAAST